MTIIGTAVSWEGKTSYGKGFQFGGELRPMYRCRNQKPSDKKGQDVRGQIGLTSGTSYGKK